MSQKRPAPASGLGRVTDRVAGALLVIVIAAAASLGLAPDLFTQRVPWDDADLGKVATATLKATRDYDIPDEETTRRMREEAVAAVRAVYVHDALALDGALQRIEAGFTMARHLEKEQLPGARPAIEQALGVRLDDAAYAALAQAHFPAAAEKAAVDLVTQAMREMVVGDREELVQHRDRGIAILRMAPSGAVTEEVLSDVSGIRDLARVRSTLGDADGTLPRALRAAVEDLARREVRVNLKFDPDRTRQRREDAAAAIKPVVIQLKKGEKVIGDGERIEERHLVIFRGMRAESDSGDLPQARLGGALFAALVVIVLAAAGTGLPRIQPARKDLLFVAGVLLAGLLLSDFWFSITEAVRDATPEITHEAWIWVAPFAAAAMLVRMVLQAEAAFLFAVGFAPLVGVLAGGSFEVAAFALAGSLVGATRVARARDRAGVFHAGLLAGIAQVAAVVSFALLDGKIASWNVVIDGAAALAGGAFFAPVLVTAILPVVESVFRYTTDLRLLELANLNHPALKELIVQAPGTYHHSIIVGTLAEGAAEAIGANPLLARVGAYYHDLGKGKSPLFFGENQRGNNRHDDLPPEESARVIIEHVARGVEIARRYKLPKQVVDAIPEHHGTRLVGYFFHKALKAAEASGGPPPDPARFRYAGPKPQSRETALIMMADAAEAASRAMPDPTPEKLQALVRKLIDGIHADGQLDECDLTLRDLTRIQQSFCRTLEAIYHSRPDYPAAAKGPQAQLEAQGKVA